MLGSQCFEISFVTSLAFTFIGQAHQREGTATWTTRVSGGLTGEKVVTLRYQLGDRSCAEFRPSRFLPQQGRGTSHRSSCSLRDSPLRGESGILNDPCAGGGEPNQKMMSSGKC